MAINAIAILELSDRHELVSCPLDELELEPKVGSQFLYNGNLYEVANEPIVSIGASKTGTRKSLNMQIAEVLSVVHGDTPVAIALFQSLKSIADGAVKEEQTVGGIILPSAPAKMEESYDRLVYIQLRFVKARKSTSLIALLSGDMSAFTGAGASALAE